VGSSRILRPLSWSRVVRHQEKRRRREDVTGGEPKSQV
jgi:hypothetical protein